ncbi:MAG: hypothetical protein FWD61_09910 [Phycisphaerales bacterium]|nr:hypothetical protein [Phycisphaerales bacterium]
MKLFYSPLRNSDEQAIGWTCFICSHCFPLSVAYTLQELDNGMFHNVSIKCAEDYEKLCQKIAEMEQQQKRASEQN